MFIDNWKVYTYSSVVSTMDQAILHLGEESKFVILASHQTKGRGKYGRPWISLEGNLYATLAFKPSLLLKYWTQISFVAALAVGKAIHEYFIKYNKPCKLSYKWPNDILIEEKKVAGVLLEIVDSSWLLVGIGVNLQGAPTNVSYPTACLREFDIDHTPLEEALVVLVKAFSEKLTILETQGFKEIRRLWLESAARLGENIEVNLPKKAGVKKLEGRFIDLDTEGRLMLKLPTKEVITITAGDVFLG